MQAACDAQFEQVAYNRITIACKLHAVHGSGIGINCIGTDANIGASA